ncbi:MAG: ROK family protein [Chloroflexi bacterium]|nr:ROK family protein [Chloroflexota bacterium]
MEGPKRATELRPIVAVDLGGTWLRVALVDSRGKVLARIAEKARSQEGPERVVDRMAHAAKALLTKNGFDAPLAVGAGVPGPIDSAGVIYEAPHLLGWKDVPIKAMLAERFPVPVWVDNDANVACLGEYTFGSGRGVKDLIYMTVSTGVGGGVISGGALVTGWRGLAGEVGHILIDPRGPRGKCGHVGCLESLVSGTAIAQLAVEALKGGHKSSLTGVVKRHLSRLKAEHVFQAAAQGDSLGRELVQQVAGDLARGIVSLVHIFNPRMFILGGGVARNWHLLAPPVQEELRQHAMKGFLDGLVITPSQLGDDVGLVGAAALAILEGDLKRG